ncbi:hypothetical protein QOT17_014456 [Balamuthia mandrillaris]
MKSSSRKDGQQRTLGLTILLLVAASSHVSLLAAAEQADPQLAPKTIQLHSININNDNAEEEQDDSLLPSGSSRSTVLSSRALASISLSPNDECEEAIELSLPASGAWINTSPIFDSSPPSPSSSSSLSSSRAATPCGYPSPGTGAWFKLVGSGEEVIISTCDEASTAEQQSSEKQMFYTNIEVLEGSSCQSLRCAALGTYASCEGGKAKTTFFSHPDRVYYVHVYGATPSYHGMARLEISTTSRKNSPMNSFCHEAPLLKPGMELVVNLTNAALSKSACQLKTEEPRRSLWFRVKGDDGFFAISTCAEKTQLEATAVLDVSKGGCFFKQKCVKKTVRAEMHDNCHLPGLPHAAELFFAADEGVDYLVHLYGRGGQVHLKTSSIETQFHDGDKCTLPKAIAAADLPARIRSSTSGELRHRPMQGCLSGEDEESRGTWFLVEGTGDVLRLTTCNPSQWTKFLSAVDVWEGHCPRLGRDEVTGGKKLRDRCFAASVMDCAREAYERVLDVPTRKGVPYYVFVYGLTILQEGQFQLDMEYIPRPPRLLCQDLLPLPLPRTNIHGTTVGALAAGLDEVTCDPPNRRGTWLHLVGDGEVLQVSNCGTGTRAGIALDVHVVTSLKAGVDEESRTCPLEGQRTCLPRSHILKRPCPLPPPSPSFEEDDHEEQGDNNDEEEEQIYRRAPNMKNKSSYEHGTIYEWLSRKGQSYWVLISTPEAPEGTAFVVHARSCPTDSETTCLPPVPSAETDDKGLLSDEISRPFDEPTKEEEGSQGENEANENNELTSSSSKEKGGEGEAEEEEEEKEEDEHQVVSFDLSGESSWFEDNEHRQSVMLRAFAEALRFEVERMMVLPTRLAARSFRVYVLMKRAESATEKMALHAARELVVKINEGDEFLFTHMPRLYLVKGSAALEDNSRLHINDGIEEENEEMGEANDEADNPPKPTKETEGTPAAPQHESPMAWGMLVAVVVSVSLALVLFRRRQLAKRPKDSRLLH